MVMLIRFIVIIFLLIIHWCRKSEQEQNINCTGTYRGTSGFIVSPGYPNIYPDNLDCQWRIQSSPGKVIKINFQDFELQEKYNAPKCEDYLMIKDMITSKVLMHKKCGKQNTPFYRRSYCHDISIIFHSDKGGGAKGFNLTWKAKQKRSDRKCSLKYTTVTERKNPHPQNIDMTSHSMRNDDTASSHETVSFPTSSICTSTRAPTQTTGYTYSTETYPYQSTGTYKQSTEETTTSTFLHSSLGITASTTIPTPWQGETTIYITLSALAFSTIIAVVVVCFALKNRLKRLLPKNTEEKEDSSNDSKGLWKRPNSFGSDVRKSVDQSKAENIYSEPNDVILSIQRQPKKPLINYDLAKILKETTLTATAPAKIGQAKVGENETNKQNGGHRHKCQSNIYDEAVPVGNTHKSPGVMTKNHVYAEIDDEICKKNVKSKDGKQNYDLAQRNMNVKSKEGKQDYDLAQPVSEEKVLKGKMKDLEVNYDLAKPKPLTNKTVNSSEDNYFILENVKHATSNDYFVLERSGKSVEPISIEESIKLGGNKNSYELAQNIYQDPTVPMSSNNGTKRVSTCPYDVSSNLMGEYDELERVTSKGRNDKNETGGGYDVSEISKMFSLKGLGKKSPYSLAKT